MSWGNLISSLFISLKKGFSNLFDQSSHTLSRASVATMPQSILLTYLAALEAGRQPDGWTEFPYGKEELAQLIKYKALGESFRQ